MTKKKKTLHKSNLFLPQVNLYNHIRKETNLTLGGELIRQRKRDSPAEWTYEWGIGMFYMRSFNAGKTYRVENGNVEQVRFAGQHYLAPSLSYCLGRNLTQKTGDNHPIFIYLKPIGFFMMPYNGGIAPNLNLQLGIKLNLNHE